MDLPPDELVSFFLAEVSRAYPADYALQVVCAHTGKGWYYVSFPYRKGDRWVVEPYQKPMRRHELVELLERIRRGEEPGSEIP